MQLHVTHNIPHSTTYAGTLCIITAKNSQWPCSGPITFFLTTCSVIYVYHVTNTTCINMEQEAKFHVAGKFLSLQVFMAAWRFWQQAQCYGRKFPITNVRLKVIMCVAFELYKQQIVQWQAGQQR